jgi:hypothetical protein
MPSLMGGDVKARNETYPVDMGSMGTGWGVKPVYSPMGAGEMFRRDLGNDPMQLLRNLMLYYRSNPQAQLQQAPLGAGSAVPMPINPMLDPNMRARQINEVIR